MPNKPNDMQDDTDRIIGSADDEVSNTAGGEFDEDDDFGDEDDTSTEDGE